MHQAGALSVLASKWSGQVVFIFEARLSQERLDLGWKEPDSPPCVQVIYLEDVDGVEAWLSSFVCDHLNALYLTNALRGSSIHRLLYPLLLKYQVNWALICEKPYFNGLWGYLKKFYYMFLFLRWRSAIGRIYCIGEHARLWFESLGCETTKLVDFQYQIDPETYRERESQISLVANVSVRFVYVGQFSRRKGVDLLLRAVAMLPKSGWTLDFYGSGGSMLPRVIEACNCDSRLHYRGVKPVSEILKVISGYKVCVVPSRFDGWGMVVNEAIASGVGVITTSTTGSSSLVVDSQAGLVVGPNVEEISAALRSAIEQPLNIDVWAEKALLYRNSVLNASQRMGDVLCKDLSQLS